MTNKVLTHQMIAREAAKMLEEEAPFIANINKGRQDEFGVDTQGYKKGDKVTIKIPTAGQVFDGAKFGGAGGTASDVIEDSVVLKLDTQKHVALEFGAKEKLLDLTDFKDRILRPQMQTLSSVVEADLIAKGVLTVPNQVAMNLAGSNPSNALALARAKLNQYLAPAGERSTILSSVANVALSGEVSRMYNPTQASSKAYLQGYVATAFGSDLYEHQSVAVFNNGTAAGLTVSAAGQTGSTITMTATTGGTLAGGQIWTYEANSTTPKITYQDPYGMTPNTNPIILDAAGEADVYLNGTYRFVVKDKNGVIQKDVSKIGSWYSGDLDDQMKSVNDLLESSAQTLMQPLREAIDAAAAAGAGENGWTTLLVQDPSSGQSQDFINNIQLLGVISLADLRSTKPFYAGHKVGLISVNRNQNEGGGEFIATRKSGLVDNGGTIISSADPNLFWVRINYEFLTPEMCGSVNNHDSTDAIERFFNICGTGIKGQSSGEKQYLLRGIRINITMKVMN